MAEARLYRSAALLCVALAVAMWMGPYLLRDDLISGDAAQHLFWMYRFLDPGYFPGDLSVAYFGDTSAAPWGYRGLYFVLSRFWDLQHAAEWMTVWLLLLNAWLVWKIARACEGPQPELRALAAVTALLMMLASQLTDIMSPLALQRSFALTFMLLCLWALITRRFMWVGVSWLLSALVYPIVLVVMGLTAAAVFGIETWRTRRLPAASLWNALAGVASLAIVMLNMTMPVGVGPTITVAQARAMAEFYPGGRLPMFGLSVHGDWLTDHHLALGYTLFQVTVIVAATLLVLWHGDRRRIPLPVWGMAGIGLAVWLVSRFMLFTLYLPNRHSRWSIACFAFIALSAAACIGVGYAERLRLLLRLPGWLRADRVAACCAPLLVAVALWPVAHRAYATPVASDMEAAYRFLQTMPKSTLVAAYPDVADMIPMRAQRSVLASTEISLPWGVTYYQNLKPRIEASLRAAYATSLEELDADLAPFGVDVMLTNASVWQQQDYYRPFDGLVRALRARGDRLGYVLRDPPAERVLFHSGGVYVVRVEHPVKAP